MKAPARLPAAWPLALAFAWLAATLGARTLAMPDEGRYAGVAWSMATSGDWLVPRLNGLPFFHKPPLFYWITAAVMHVAGPVEWAARIAPLLGAMAGATALYFLARRWQGERVARLALLALCTQVLAFLGAQFANLDMLVAGCITVTVVAFAHAALLDAEGQRPQATLATGYLFAALGVLAKGLIGVVVPGLVLVAWLLLQWRWRLLLRLAWWPGVLLFLLVAAPWFLLVQRRFPDFAWYFFYVQHFARYVAGGFNNRQPMVFYPVVLLALAFPWSVWALRGWRSAVPAPRGTPASAVRVLAWTWLAAVVAFFSLPQSKPVGYIFPAAFPLAWLAAQAVGAGVPSPRVRRWWRASAGLAAVACAGAVLFAVLRPFHSMRAIGVALRQAAPEDRVVLVRNDWFDVPVYAGLRRPAAVLDDWSAANTQQHDDWRKALADAARFDPVAARDILLPLDAASSALCSGTTTTWVVAEAADARQLPPLAALPPVATQGNVRLWRLDASARQGCRQAAAPQRAPLP